MAAPREDASAIEEVHFNAPKGSVGMSVYGGIVISVQTDSIAASLGVKRGWRVIMVKDRNGDSDVTPEIAHHRLRGAIETGGPFTVRFKTGGTPKSADLPAHTALRGIKDLAASVVRDSSVAPVIEPSSPAQAAKVPPPSKRAEDDSAHQPVAPTAGGARPFPPELSHWSSEQVGRFFLADMRNGWSMRKAVSLQLNGEKLMQMSREELGSTLDLTSNEVADCALKWAAVVAADVRLASGSAISPMPLPRPPPLVLLQPPPLQDSATSPSKTHPHHPQRHHHPSTPQVEFKLLRSLALD
jgi:hypothetical protein